MEVEGSVKVRKVLVFKGIQSSRREDDRLEQNPDGSRLIRQGFAGAFRGLCYEQCSP